jgi:hypothetical protein
MKFLTAEDLQKKDDNGKYVMDGAVIGFLMDDKAYSARLTISSMGVYLCQTRIPCETTCPDKKDLRFAWGVRFEEVQDYFMFQDEEILPQLVDIDRATIEFYKDNEKIMADFDKKSMLVGLPVIKESLKVKHEIAEKALRAAQKAIEELTSEDGIEEQTQTLKTKSDERCEKATASWDK